MVLLLLFALVGHAFLWVAAINRVHGMGAVGWRKDAATVVGFAGLLLIPVGYGFWLARTGWTPIAPGTGGLLAWAALAYLGLCCGGAVVATVGWLRRHVLHRPPLVLRYHRSRVFDVPEISPDRTTPEDQHHFLVRLPGNEVLQLDVAERAVEVPRLPRALDGLSVVHLSDLHFSGRVGKSYFEEVVRQSNAFQPDLVAVTGDLVDKPACLGWAPEILGKLTARAGVYFVLGNHDRQVDSRRLRQLLGEAGLVDLGGRWQEVEIRGRQVVLAGNELPWFSPAADLAQAPPRRDEGLPFRIALAHSPDQLAWARGHDVDLLLAGHTHGGQIRLPFIGPVFTPCRVGVKYAWGVYHAPPTILHVTRGVSGEFPVRMNCPPEMVHLVLHAPPA